MAKARMTAVSRKVIQDALKQAVKVAQDEVEKAAKGGDLEKINKAAESLREAEKAARRRI